MKPAPGLAWVLLSPTILILSVFVFYPAFQSFYLSMQDVDPFSRLTYFVGLENYQSLVTSPEYWQSVRTSFVFMALTVIPSIILSLFIAMGLDANPYLRSFFRTIFLMPVSISSAMAAMLWIFLYNPTAGYLNYILEMIGLTGPNWLGSPRWAMVAVSIATVWKEIGFNVIFFIAGLSSVPVELKEAAWMDGANALQRFRYVILPILSPTIFFVTVVSIINSFQSFGQIHILTGGGPAGATDTLVYRLYQDAFVNFQSGLASAEAMFLFLILMVGTIFQFRFAQRRVHYG